MNEKFYRVFQSFWLTRLDDYFLVTFDNFWNIFFEAASTDCLEPVTKLSLPSSWKKFHNFDLWYQYGINWACGQMLFLKHCWFFSVTFSECKFEDQNDSDRNGKLWRCRSPTTTATATPEQPRHWPPSNPVRPLLRLRIDKSTIFIYWYFLSNT